MRTPVSAVRNALSAALASAFAISTAQAGTMVMNLDYVASNAVANTIADAGYDGRIAAHTGYASIGTITIQDLSDLGEIGAGYGGVRVTVSANDMSNVFGAGSGNLWVRSLELNFPGTGDGGPGCTPASPENCYLARSDQWAQISGVPLTGGIEWDEGGRTDSWDSTEPDGTRGFSQELNFTGGTFNENSFVDGSVSVFDLYSTAELSLSVAALLADSNGDSIADGLVRNTDPDVGSSLPMAWAWFRLNGTGADDGIASSGWWGNSPNGGVRVNVLATSYSVAPVPVPAAIWMLAPALGALGATARRRRR